MLYIQCISAISGPCVFSLLDVGRCTGKAETIG